MRVPNLLPRILCRTTLTFAALSGIGATAAHGTTLPVPITAATCVAYAGGSASDPTSCALSGLPASLNVNASLTLSPAVMLSAHADYAGGINLGGQASTSAQYYFQVEGGVDGDVVPLLIQTSLSSSGSGGAGASLRVHTSAELVDQEVDVCTNPNGFCAVPSTFSGSLETHASSGAVGDYINIFASAGVGDSLTPETAASVDPFIFIDPSFANASGYSIVLSDGVGNAVSPVPEPAAALMTITGILLVVTTRRRRPMGRQACRGI